MYRPIVKWLVLTSFELLFALPAPAQVRADLGPLHIRIANDGPPRARYEQRTARPNRDAVWIGGFWDRRDDTWAWQSGRWEQPNDRHARWIKARYKHEGRAWRYEPAHWSNQQLVEGEDYQNWRREQHR